MKMVLSKKLARFGAGLLGTIILITLIYYLIIPVLHTWGSTAEEVSAQYPGDDLVADPDLTWTHAITIHADPDVVWQWIAQMGDVRAAFYSYTFIENMIAGERMYVNADQIVADWQHPVPGDGMIMDFLVVDSLHPGRYLLASHGAPLRELGMQWTWLWQIEPTGDGNTRLIVRHNITPPDGFPKVILFFVDAGGFVMERRMMLGLQHRAEGRLDPPMIEVFEIVLWLWLFALGLVAAWHFVARSYQVQPLLFGTLVICTLFVYTYIQPPILIRLIGNFVFTLAWGIVIKRMPYAHRSQPD